MLFSENAVYICGMNFWFVIVFIHILTQCRRLTQKCAIAHPCVVDGPRISAFSYTTSNTRVFELV